MCHRSLTGPCPTSLSWWAPAGRILQQGRKGEVQLLIPVMGWGVCWTLFLSFLEADMCVSSGLMMGKTFLCFQLEENPQWLMVPSLYHALLGGTVLSSPPAEKLHTLCPANSTTLRHSAAEETGTQARAGNRFYILSIKASKRRVVSGEIVMLTLSMPFSLVLGCLSICTGE